MRKNLRPGCPGMLCATKTLTFKTRVSAKSLWCKGVLFAWDEYEIFFKPIPSHLASLWHWALEQLSNCQFSLYLYCYLFPFFYFSLVFQYVGYHKNSYWTRLPERRKNKSPARKISLLQQHHQFQQYYDNDDDNDNDNDNVDNDDDNDNKQNKSKIAASKNMKLPPTFRATW